jgi:hypothetical protein
MTDKIIRLFLKRKYKQRYAILECLYQHQYKGLQNSQEDADLLSLTMAQIAIVCNIKLSDMMQHIQNHINCANPGLINEGKLLFYITKDGTFAFFNDYHEKSLDKQMGFAKHTATTILAIVGLFSIVRALVLWVLSIFKINL